MKIVVLDGYCLNPGDLNWDALRAIGEVELHDRTPAADTMLVAETPEMNNAITVRSSAWRALGKPYSTIDDHATPSAKA